MDSISSVAENAQHEPHCPWSLTGEIAPVGLQSQVELVQGEATEEGAGGRGALKPSMARLRSTEAKGWYLRSLLRNSWTDKSENLVKPKIASPPGNVGCVLLSNTGKGGTVVGKSQLLLLSGQIGLGVGLLELVKRKSH